MFYSLALNLNIDVFQPDLKSPSYGTSVITPNLQPTGEMFSTKGSLCPFPAWKGAKRVRRVVGNWWIHTHPPRSTPQSTISDLFGRRSWRVGKMQISWMDMVGSKMRKWWTWHNWGLHEDYRRIGRRSSTSTLSGTPWRDERSIKERKPPKKELGSATSLDGLWRSSTFVSFSDV